LVVDVSVVAGAAEVLLVAGTPPPVLVESVLPVTELLPMPSDGLKADGASVVVVGEVEDVGEAAVELVTEVVDAAAAVVEEDKAAAVVEEDKAAAVVEAESAAVVEAESAAVVEAERAAAVVEAESAAAVVEAERAAAVVVELEGGADGQAELEVKVILTKQLASWICVTLRPVFAPQTMFRIVLLITLPHPSAPLPYTMETPLDGWLSKRSLKERSVGTPQDR